MIDYRFGSRKETKDLAIKAKTNLSTYTLPNLTRKVSSQGSLVKEAVMITSDDKVDDKQNQGQDLPYVFTPNKMPSQKQLFYQLCDVHDSEIQRLISINDGQVCDCLASSILCIVILSLQSRDFLVRPQFLKRSTSCSSWE